MPQSAPPPTAPPLPQEKREAAGIASILLSVGAVAVLVGALSFSGQSIAKFLLPLFAILFALGGRATYKKALRISAEIFASVAIGLAVCELWVVFQPRNYGSFANMLRAWADGDGATLTTVAAIAIGMMAFTAGLVVFLKRKSIALITPLVWLFVAIAVSLLTGLVYVTNHAASHFEILTIPLSLVLVGAGEYALSRNDRISSLETVTWGLLVGFIPTGIAAYIDVLSYHAVVLSVLFVAALIYGFVLKRKAPLFITPGFYLLYCLCAIISVGHDVKPWVWLMVGGTIVIACGASWEKLYREAKAGRDRLSALR